MPVSNTIFMSVYDDSADDGTNNQSNESSDAGNYSEKTQEHNSNSDDGGESSNAENDNQKNQRSQEAKDGHRANPNGDDTDDEDNDSSPPMRKSKLQYIKERQERARQKREKQQLENRDHNQRRQSDNADYDQDEDESDNESYESLPDNERKMYDRFESMFLKKHGTKLEKASKAADIAEENETNAEITEFLKNHEYSDLVGKFEGKLRKFANHPSRKNVPINEILFGIAGEELIAFGAELARKSMNEARQSQNGGGSNRKVEGDSGEKDYRKMPIDKFLEEQKRVLQGRN